MTTPNPLASEVEEARKNQPNGFKLGFDATNRTIRPPVLDGTRVRDIQIRLHDIHAIKMRDEMLPIELANEKNMLVEEWYLIERAKFEKFEEGKR